MESRFQLAGGGTLRIVREGTRALVEVERPDDGRGLYRAALHGARGSFALGALTPDAGRLRLSRRIPIGRLEQEGCWPVTGGEVSLACAFERTGWVCEGDPSRLVRDEVLRDFLKDRPMFLRRQENGFALAARFDPCAPFPLPPLFCLGRIERDGGETRVVFQFDENGAPVLA